MGKDGDEAVVESPSEREEYPPDDPLVLKPLGNSWRCLIQMEDRFPDDRIRPDELVDAGLGDLNILRQRGGTNFAVESDHVPLLDELIRTRQTLLVGASNEADLVADEYRSRLDEAEQTAPVVEGVAIGHVAAFAGIGVVVLVNMAVLAPFLQ